MKENSKKALLVPFSYSGARLDSQVRVICELDLQAATFHFSKLIADSSLRIELANR